MSFLNPLYHAVAFLLVHIHDGVKHVVPNSNGWSWALSIVALTMAMRLALFPVFVKQIRNQRAMQALQPKMKELQAKYKNDKEKLNQEMMALWRENNANPLSGCLPLLLQIPIFISLFHTLREIKPTCTTIAAHLSVAAHQVCHYQGVPGFTSANIESAAHAKIFGVPIPASFTTSSTTLRLLGAPDAHTSTRILALALTIIMGATTFITQRQLMSQNTSAASPQMAQQQKILLYVFPLVFLFYGFKFPIGVLVYWLTTNLWSMVQQRVIIRRMDAPSTDVAATAVGPAVGAKPQTPPRGPAPKPKPAAAGDITLPPGGAIPTTPPPRPAASSPRRPTNNRSKKRKKGRR